MLIPAHIAAVVFPHGPSVWPTTRVTVESVRQVFAQLDPADAQRFKRDLQIYESTRERSPFLLRILNTAAGELCDG